MMSQRYLICTYKWQNHDEILMMLLWLCSTWVSY